MSFCRWLITIACAAACGADPTDESAAIDAWEIRASAPGFAGASVTGAFRADGDGMRSFGACLVADLHGGKSCSSDADCASGAVVALADVHHVYCLRPQGASGSSCWTRNGADPAWCNKVPPPGRAAGDYTTPALDAAAIAGAGQKTRWATLACLNAGTYPAFSDGPLPPCASADPAAAGYRVFATSAVSSYTAP